ncbi:fungal-specific transcription factor domain-containing protein [Roridomyces roridus]|uniref:Fungal-specific transcription factor domain-containing protein n=1 Tax=Roridomyces roridus TaxID=1738132 RepID=A0AAD7C3T0_9AGAR|nr:fungal-specific transcription factor domain-containing protein [Roridomyces roridus]
MPDECGPSSSTTSPANPRPKPPKTPSTGIVRGRTSPGPGGSSAEQNGDGPRPTKRARKAINCEPCRNSKLKCDRNRPCSSCVLRGTAAMCYQDARGHEGAEYPLRGDDHQRIDPAQEIARLRHSISLLEAYVFPTQPRSHAARRSDTSPVVPKKESVDPDMTDKNPPTAPGMLGQGQGGLYAGPTSAATHLLLSHPDARNSEDTDSRQASQDRSSDDLASTVNHEYDRDLLALLPSVDIIDSLINYYFEYCNWIYRHVNQLSFIQQWEKYKNGSCPDRIILATACVIMANATYYLPPQHRILEAYPETHEELGLKYFEVSTTALQRRQAETKTYSLDLIELLLIRCHYLTATKRDGEEVWYAKGEIVTIGTAMGLHRDPGKWKMHRDVAERRRWAWWHIVLLERWQAFMFGRPITISSHHFDTLLPSYCDPSLDKTGRLYLPNIALFQLAFILGDIMDDAVSVRPVPYDSVQANDRALTKWMDNLPPELDLDEYRLARNLVSSNVPTRRLGVQSVIIRTSYYHIRFTLHRPYASANANKMAGSELPKSAQSLEIAVNAADRLITMTGQSRPDFLNANSALSTPGHMNWGPFHCFSAAMFFSFQLIANPDQPGANLFRASVRKAMTTLEQSRGVPVADKGLDILQSLAPLYSSDFPRSDPEAREKEKAKILGIVRKLAFPYHDSRDPRRMGESPSTRGLASSPANSNSVSPPMNMIHPLPQYEGMSHTISSVRTAAPPPIYTQNPHSPASQQQMSPGVVSHPHSISNMPPNSSPGGYNPPYHLPPPQQSYGPERYGTYPHQHVDDQAVWGAAIGFGHGEWTQFLDVLRPEQASGNSSRMQGP